MLKQLMRRLESATVVYSVYQASSGQTLVIESRFMRDKVRRVLYSPSPRGRTYFVLSLHWERRVDGLTDILEVSDTSGRIFQIERHHIFTKEANYLEAQSHMYLYIGNDFDPRAMTIVPFSAPV